MKTWEKLAAYVTLALQAANLSALEPLTALPRELDLQNAVVECEVAQPNAL